MAGITVIICCFNSSSRLKPTLLHLARQVCPLECELIVVDNNSSDDTAEFALAEWRRLGEPFPIRIVSELTPGLANARRTGAQSASYDILCFCDDDNWLSEDYLRIAFEVMSSDQRIGVLAGQNVATSDDDLPNWFYSYYRAFACGVLSLESGDVTRRLEVWGAGMVLRKSVFLSLIQSGFRNLVTGREGSNLMSGEDTEICFWHVLVGYKLWYDRRLRLRHFMPRERLSEAYAAKLIQGQKSSGKKLKVYKQLVQGMSQKRLTVLSAAAVIRTLLRMIGRNLPASSRVGRLSEEYYLFRRIRASQKRFATQKDVLGK